MFEELVFQEDSDGYCATPCPYEKDDIMIGSSICTRYCIHFLSLNKLILSNKTIIKCLYKSNKLTQLISGVYHGC